MRGIMFKEPLFNATVAGTKTQTRRRIEADPRTEKVELQKDGRYAIINKKTGEVRKCLRPTYKEDSVVFLKEPYAPIEQDIGDDEIRYKFNYTKVPNHQCSD